MSNPTVLEFVGMPAIVASQPMLRLLAMAEKVARTDSAVLIGGESGAGKELIARAIHHYSPRRDKMFVDINCAAFPEHLIESELFGYEKGAFSGAETVKPGIFETAAGGTLFLDEIGELDSRMQPKLLRILDGQPYFRLGGTRKIQTTARVVAASNINLLDAVRRGRFREDLYHRLDVFQLQVPPLRERVEDIVPLCDLFLRSLGCTLRGDALKALQEYTWPGNVRELRNVLTKAAMFADGSELAAADLPASVTYKGGGVASPRLSLETIEKEAIFQALEQTGGHQQKAADLLGIARRTLIRKLKLYGAPENSRENGHGAHGSGSKVDAAHRAGGAGPGVRL